IKDSGRYGTIGGVHLDLPFGPGEEAAYAKLVSGLRKKVPPTMLLSLSLRFSPATPSSDELKALLASCDGLVAFLAGGGALADPVATDSLDKTWWAGFAPAARGTWTSAGGENRGPLPERVLARLSNDTRVRFLQDLALKDTSDSSFTLVPREPVSLPGYSFQTGDRLNFHQPIPSDVLYGLGDALKGRRLVRGRVVCLSGRSEQDRILTLNALAEVLAGKPSLVALHVLVEAGKGSVELDAENTSPHPSIMSATANWIEVEIPSAGVLQGQTGGLDPVAG